MFVLGLLLSAPSLDSTKLTAEQSVWVYSHAGSPGSDEFLRIWGIDGSPVPDKAGDIDEFSFGYLKFNVTGLKPGKPTKATLILHTFFPTAMTADQFKQTPLEARPLRGEFEAATWSFGDGQTVTPSDGKNIFGNSALIGGFSADKSMEIDIDLLKGPASFADVLAKALDDPKHKLYIALTSGVTASQSGAGSAGGVYKVYSAATKSTDLAPQLVIEY